MSTTIRPFPELREYAEEEARVCEAVAAGEPAESWEPWDRLSEAARSRIVRARVAVLCDLTRPGSCDVVCRLVTKRLGDPTRATGVMLAAIVAHLWPENGR